MNDSLKPRKKRRTRWGVAMCVLLDYVSPCFSDKTFIKLKFRLLMGRRLDLEHPQTYNEKLQWLKLYDRNPLYATLVDKIEVKRWVAAKIGEEHIIPTLATYDRAEEIEFDTLPEQFVLKCTHNSGGIVICSDKSKLDSVAARRKLTKGLRSNYYRYFREWPYKRVKPRIICERYMVDESCSELKDYKWYCFDGEPKALLIATDRGKADEELKMDFFDPNFNRLPVCREHPNATTQISKPAGFDEMKRLAALLSKAMPHVRCDFYDIDGHIYFGEMTFYPASGLAAFEPPQWDKTFGDWLTLPISKASKG